MNRDPHAVVKCYNKRWQGQGFGDVRAITAGIGFARRQSLSRSRPLAVTSLPAVRHTRSSFGF
jgi:hypothetical protein